MSTSERFQFRSSDGLSIACVKWGNPHHVRGVVQIAHGLGEHISRYAELAETLAQAEFIVYGNDHRGHGLTAKPSGSFGEFGPSGFDQLVEDMVSLRVIAKKEHPDKPYILLGHSMGSFAAQQFIVDHGHSIDGLADNGQPDPCPLVLVISMDALKHLEQLCLPGLINADAIVFKPKAHLMVHGLGVNPNPGLHAGGDKLDGVVEKIADALS